MVKFLSDLWEILYRRIWEEGTLWVRRTIYFMKPSTKALMRKRHAQHLARMEEYRQREAQHKLDLAEYARRDEEYAARRAEAERKMAEYRQARPQ